MRGYCCIGLDNPKTPVNVGSVLRAAHVYGAALVAVSGRRFHRSCSDTTKAWRHMPVMEAADVFDALPYDCVPVAVDLIEGATPLPRYVHPERAFYIFGAEDQTLGKRITDRCRDTVMVPTKFCMNLAATVNVVLYDRMAKAMADESLLLPVRGQNVHRLREGRGRGIEKPNLGELQHMQLARA